MNLKHPKSKDSLKGKSYRQSLLATIAGSGPLGLAGLLVIVVAVVVAIVLLATQLTGQNKNSNREAKPAGTAPASSVPEPVMGYAPVSGNTNSTAPSSSPSSSTPVLAGAAPTTQAVRTPATPASLITPTTTITTATALAPALVSPGAAPPGTGTGPGAATARPVGSDHYGLIVTGLDSVPDKTASLNRALELTQARWWYQYTPGRPTTTKPPAQQIYLVRTWHGGVNGNDFKEWMQFIKDKGHFDSPTYWLIGNEPNVDGQDDTLPEVYAQALHEADRLIRAADPRSTIIGPNILNFEATCQSCSGFTSGREWVDKMREAYQTLFKTEPPFDAWSLHTYSLNWDKLPLVDQPQDAAQIEAYRAYLDQAGANRDKPVWLTEFGVVWGYDALDWQKNEAGEWLALPVGAFRQELLEQYLTSSLDWLEANAGRLKLDRWFVFTSYGTPEPFSQIFAGISLFDNNSPGANLTASGRIYADRIKKASLKN